MLSSKSSRAIRHRPAPSAERLRLARAVFEALVRTAQDYGAPSRLVETTVAVNESRKSSMAMRVINACGGSVRGKTIAVLGLTFKPETDDMRDSPSLPILARWRRLPRRARDWRRAEPD